MKSLLFLMLSITLFIGSPFTGWAKELKEPYKIGVVNNSTGAFGMFGIPLNDGVRLAAEVINRAGGVDGHLIVPIIYDGETKPDVCLRMARKLINQDKVKVLIGPNNSAGIKAIAPVANEAKIPMINFGALTIDTATNPYVFSGGTDNDLMAEGLVEYYHRKGIKKIALLAVKSSYGEEWTAATRKYVAKYPDMSIIAVEWFMYEDTDITPQMGKLIEMKPDVINSPSGGAGTLLAARTAYNLGFKGPFAGTHADVSKPFAESIKDLPTGYTIIPAKNTWCILEKARVAAMPSGPRKTYSLKIMSEWEKKHGNLNDIYYGTSGYENTDIFAQAFKAVGYNSEKVKRWLESTEIMTTRGLLKMTPTDHRGASPENMTILITENGRFLPAK
jgi:branched-chain amino acid transport system substrate-binding protein